MSDFLSYKSKVEEEELEKNDQEQFKKLNLNESDLKDLKLFVSNDVSITGLISLFFLEKREQSVNESVKDELLLRDYITEDGKITETGIEYLNTDEVKERFKQLL